MAPRKWIDKKTATTFALVHRAQNDPLINDADAPSMVFAELEGPVPKPGYQQSSSSSSKKIKERGDLEEEFGLNFRKNEGQAAEQGVFYDDTAYDYMQHMRDIGSGGGEATWVPAKQQQDKNGNKGKGKQQSLADALREMDLEDDGQSVASSRATAKSLLPEELLGSEFVRKTTYQDQQDIPDAIAGFQPDMDPRLREALEALEDDAYVNDDEEDFFAELAKGGEAVDPDDWEASGWDDEEEDDQGWESDATIKADEKRSSSSQIDTNGQNLPPPTEDITAAPPADPTNGAWLDEFAKFKQAVKDSKAPTPRNANAAADQQTINTGLSSLASGRRKKRKGAMTNPSAYSMTSSALARTDAQTLLDQRFDKIEEEYAEGYDQDGDYDYDDDDDSRFDDATSLASGMTGASRMSKYSTASGMSRASGISTYSRARDTEAPELVRTDFDSIMDGFLAGHSRQAGKGRRIKKSGYQTGMQQLDEIRGGLGAARFTGGRRPERY